jgi:hypothetical protein
MIRGKVIKKSLCLSEVPNSMKWILNMSHMITAVFIFSLVALAQKITVDYQTKLLSGYCVGAALKRI